MTVVDVLYFTAETIGTVGHVDFSFRDQPTWLRLFAIGLMTLGATLATVFFALLTNVLVGRTIAEELGRRRVPGMSGHVVVVGIGSIRVRDEANRYLAQVRGLGVPVVIGDATLGATLEAANLPAPWFVGAALGLDVLGTLYVGDAPLLVGRLPVAAGGGLDGLTMQDLAATIRVVAIARSGSDHLEHLPRRATRLPGGDDAYLVGPYEELLRVLRRDAGAAQAPAAVGRHHLGPSTRGES